MLCTENHKLTDKINNVFFRWQELERMNRTYEKQIAYFYESVEKVFYHYDSPSKVNKFSYLLCVTNTK